MKLSERITRWRESQDVTKAELARRVGVSSAAVAQWEDEGEDATEPTHDNVEKIAEAIGVSLPAFWGEPPAGRAHAKQAPTRAGHSKKAKAS